MATRRIPEKTPLRSPRIVDRHAYARGLELAHEAFVEEDPGRRRELTELCKLAWADAFGRNRGRL
jgi:hypothetical protein